MPYPHCQSTATTERPDCTALGYRRFRCRDCKYVFNERTGTPFNRLQYPTDVVSLVVLWRFGYKLSLRDLAGMFLQWGILFTHETVREWESKLTPLLSETLRKRRHSKVGKSWYVDETYGHIQGRWCYLYRAIDRDVKLVDVRLSVTRDLTAAEAFFRCHSCPLLSPLRRDPPVFAAPVATQSAAVTCTATGHPSGAVCPVDGAGGGRVNRVRAIHVTSLTLVARKLTQPVRRSSMFTDR